MGSQTRVKPILFRIVLSHEGEGNMSKTEEKKHHEVPVCVHLDAISLKYAALLTGSAIAARVKEHIKRIDGVSENSNKNHSKRFKKGE